MAIFDRIAYPVCDPIQKTAVFEHPRREQVGAGKRKAVDT
jgi:hypothetical protein